MPAAAAKVVLSLAAIASFAVWCRQGIVAPLKDIHGVAWGDFGSFYMAGWCALHGHDIYDLPHTRALAKTLGAPKGPPALPYPPHIAMLFAPVAAVFTPLAAARIGIVVNGLLYWASVWVLLRGVVGARAWGSTAAVIGASWFVPSWQTIGAGQINIVVLFLTATGLWAFRIGRLGRSGAMLGLAALLKGLAGAVAAYFLLRRKISSLLSMAVVCALVVVAAVVTLGVTSHRDYVARELPDISRRVPAGRYDVSLKSFSHRVIGALGPTKGSKADRRADALVGTLSAAFLAGVAVLMLLPRRDTVELGLGRMGLLLMTAMILNVWTWIHHLVVALPPLAVAARGVRQGVGWRRAVEGGIVTVAFCFMAVSTQTPWADAGTGVLHELLRSSSVNFYGMILLWVILALQVSSGGSRPATGS